MQFALDGQATLGEQAQAQRQQAQAEAARLQLADLRYRNGVASYLDLLDRRAGDALDDKGREYLRQAGDGAKRMRRLIDDLLLYSRVANEEPRRERVDLRELVGGVLEMLGPAIEETGFRWRL